MIPGFTVPTGLGDWIQAIRQSGYANYNFNVNSFGSAQTTAKVASIAIGGLQTTARYVDHIVVEIYSDSALTTLVGTQTSAVTWNGTANVQKDVILLDGLTYGTQYWLRAGVVAPVSGDTVWSATFSVTAGTANPPAVTYTGTYTATTSGVSFLVTPGNVPANIDHYEAVWTLDGSTPPETTIPYITHLLPAQTGAFHFGVVLSSAQTATVFVRAVNQNADVQAWTSLGAYTPSTAYSGSFTGTIAGGTTVTGVSQLSISMQQIHDRVAATIGGYTSTGIGNVPDGGGYAKTYSAVLQGNAIPTAYGKNLVPNPGFEINNGPTYWPSAAQGQYVCDNWEVNALNANAFEPRLRGGYNQHGGSNDLEIINVYGAVLNANTTYTCRVLSAPINVREGESFYLSGWRTFEQSVAPPAGVSLDQRIGVLFFTNTGGQATEYYPPDLSGPSGWVSATGTFTIPAGIAYMRLQCSTFIIVGASSVTTDASNPWIDAFFDDVALVSLLDYANEIQDGTLDSNGVPWYRLTKVGSDYRLRWASIYGDTSDDTTTAIVDGANKRFLHGAMSGATQAVINSSSQIINSAVISGRTEGIGTTVGHLTSVGQVDDLANVNDGALWRKLKGVGADNLGRWASLYGDTSGDTTTELVDAANKRFVHGAMSTGVQGAVTSASQFIGNNTITATASGYQSDLATIHDKSANKNPLNLVVDDDFEAGTASVGHWSGATFSVVAVTGQSFGHALQALKTTTAYDIADGNGEFDFPVKGGEYLWVQFWLNSTSSTTSGGFGLMTGEGGSTPYSYVNPQWPGVAWSAGTGWTFYSGWLQLDANATLARVYIAWHPAVNDTIQFAQLYIGRMRPYPTLNNVASDGALHASTALNPQGSVLPNSGVAVNTSQGGSAGAYTLTPSTPGGSIPRPDGSTLTVGSSTGPTSGALGYSVTAYCFPRINVTTGAVDWQGGYTTSPTAAVANGVYADGYIPAVANPSTPFLSYTTPATSGGSGTGGSGGGSGTCPADDQMMESLPWLPFTPPGWVRGRMRPARCVKSGGFVRGGDGRWKRVALAFSAETYLQYVQIGEQVYHTTSNHWWLKPGGDFTTPLPTEPEDANWIRQDRLGPGSVVAGGHTVLVVSRPHWGSFREITLAQDGDRSIRMGGQITHNYQTS